MKTILKTVAIVFISFAIFSCDNDSNPSPNDTQCNYQGLTFLDTSNNTQTLLPESDLTTEYFPNSSNGPEVEIYGGTPFVVFTTTAVTVGATENTSIIINGTTYPITVTCQRAGTAVGDEFRFDLIGSGAEAEYCVVIDAVIP
ncbi:MAG: hypothetical protein COB73_09665 [Flavobacteriaceae bacterium]|nr:MAG: hypothetical protein COB73_09665 [Flavobacteriaceae bacterium]